MIKFAAAALVATAAGFGPALAAGDAKKGEKVFRKCKACHMVGEKAKNRVGPILTGVVGRKAGAAEGYKYSKTNALAGEEGLVWTEENIAAYLPGPQKFLEKFLKEKGKKAPGRTKMVYKLKKEKEVADVVAYLATFSPKAEGEDAASGEAATQ
ncbi:MAG: c-type cytochrome [Pseudomonadota bacterium]